MPEIKNMDGLMIIPTIPYAIIALIAWVLFFVFLHKKSILSRIYLYNGIITFILATIQVYGVVMNILVDSSLYESLNFIDKILIIYSVVVLILAIASIIIGVLIYKINTLSNKIHFIFSSVLIIQTVIPLLFLIKIIQPLFVVRLD
jgi:hypothetical protein